MPIGWLPPKGLHVGRPQIAGDGEPPAAEAFQDLLGRDPEVEDGALAGRQALAPVGGVPLQGRPAARTIPVPSRLEAAETILMVDLGPAVDVGEELLPGKVVHSPLASPVAGSPG